MWKSRKVVILIAVVLIGAGLLGQVWSQYTWDHYFTKLPHSPDVRTGRVYSDNYHGVGVYETRDEHFRLHLIENGSATMVLAGLVLGAILGRRKPPLRRSHS